MSVRIAAGELRAFVYRLMRALRVPHEASAIMADSLVAADLRGVDSHGVQLLTFYVPQIEERRIDIAATGRIVTESGATLNYDGGNALGQVVSDICAAHAVRLARNFGLGLVTARESNHFGAAAWWAEKIAREGMIGIVMCTASAIVAPWQGRDPRWGTNPICVAVPGGGWLLDMATTTVAMGKIYKAGVNKWEEIPPGWAMDSEGVPTTSTAEALKGMLMPLGGYKGSGLAMMVEMLCGVLSGGALSTEQGGLRIKDRPFRVNQFFLAIDVSRWMPPEEFERRKSKLVAMAKSSRPARGFDEVLVAGDPEWRTESERLRDGIPVSASLWNELATMAARFGVDPPHAPGGAS